ncbi:MAG: hypothetical protein HON90_00060 [Halobacteriovoraceae bacterium]|jgi:hypothetical protein|nr:hypothetical protein [Halobacteriovoraceae bacterium]
MNKVYRNISNYADVINTIANWKIIDIKSLHQFLSFEISYYTLKRKICDLEKSGMVKSFFTTKRNKYVFLTDKGIQFSSTDKTFEPCDVEQTHDLLVVKLVQEMLGFSKVTDGKLYHQVNDNYINPDAVVKILSDDTEYTIAIELELTQKSQKRVKDKYAKYGNSYQYDYCLYISNKPKLIKTYQTYLEQMEEKTQSKFFFISKCDLSNAETNLLVAKCFHKGRELDLKVLFGVKGEATMSATIRNHTFAHRIIPD